MSVEVKRAKMETCGIEINGWVARYDGTEAEALGREEALRKLVVAVAQESL